MKRGTHILLLLAAMILGVMVRPVVCVGADGHVMVEVSAHDHTPDAHQESNTDECRDLQVLAEAPMSASLPSVESAVLLAGFEFFAGAVSYQETFTARPEVVAHWRDHAMTVLLI